MLRILLLLSVQNKPINKDRIVALDFMCIYGKSCKVLRSNLHGDNPMGFSEFTMKRERITEALKLSVTDDFVKVTEDDDGFRYSINDRGTAVVKATTSDYSKAYITGAKIVCRRFQGQSEDELLRYINKQAATKEA